MAQLNLRLLLICQLYSSVDGLGTDERTLARIVCLRAEKDLDELKREYRRYFGEELNEKIHSDTSGQFQKLLLTLVGESGRRV
ncbi:unnamed protein product [Calicophoron daubneyi]|uniref:Annexin n=1 Tax=Calicophoron daubneyi TaxID=300641 RepID=A0AAV2T0Q9_CALDB